MFRRCPAIFTQTKPEGNVLSLETLMPEQGSDSQGVPLIISVKLLIKYSRNYRRKYIGNSQRVFELQCSSITSRCEKKKKEQSESEKDTKRSNFKRNDETYLN